MGAAGAAVATVFAQVIVFVLYVISIRNEQTIFKIFMYFPEHLYIILKKLYP